MDRKYYVITFFKNTFILRRLVVATFSDIIKISTMFIEKTYNTQTKLEGLCIKMQSISVFLHIIKIAAFRWQKADVTRTQGVSHVIYMFLDLF